MFQSHPPTWSPPVKPLSARARGLRNVSPPQQAQPHVDAQPVLSNPGSVTAGRSRSPRGQVSPTEPATAAVPQDVAHGLATRAVHRDLAGVPVAVGGVVSHTQTVGTNQAAGVVRPDPVLVWLCMTDMRTGMRMFVSSIDGQRRLTLPHPREANTQRWCCPSCQTSNALANAAPCSSCGLPLPPCDPFPSFMVGGSSSPATQPGAGAASGGGIAAAVAGMSTPSAPANSKNALPPWLCRACAASNAFENDACDACGAPHPVVMDRLSQAMQEQGALRRQQTDAAGVAIDETSDHAGGDGQVAVAAPSLHGVSVQALLVAARFAGKLKRRVKGKESNKARKERHRAARQGNAPTASPLKRTSSKKKGREPAKLATTRHHSEGRTEQADQHLSVADQLLQLTLLTPEDLRAKAAHRIERSRENELNLSRLGLTREDIVPIVRGLGKNRVLCLLNLERNDLGSAGAAHIGAAIAKNRFLRTSLTGMVHGSCTAPHASCRHHSLVWLFHRSQSGVQRHHWIRHCTAAQVTDAKCCADPTDFRGQLAGGDRRGCCHGVGAEACQVGTTHGSPVAASQG